MSRKCAYFALLVLAALLFSEPLSAQSRRRKKDREKVEVVRITVSLSELADSVDAASERVSEEFREQLESDCISGRYALEREIDRITGFKAGAKGSRRGELAVALAMEHLGKPYVWAANGPDAFDCSGFTRFIYRQIGIDIPRHSGDQYKKGRHIESVSELNVGDLVFFGTRRRWRNVGHVGIVVEVDRERGRYSFIHASSSGGVRISPGDEAYFLTRFVGGGRYITD